MNEQRGSVSIEDFDEAAATFDEDFRVRRALSVAAHIADRARLGPGTSALDLSLIHI